MGAWALGAWATGAWAGTAWAESPTPPTDEAFGGYGPLLRIRRHDDEGDILAVISAFMHIQQEE